MKQWLEDAGINCSYLQDGPEFQNLIACGRRGLVYYNNVCLPIAKANTMARMRAPVSAVGTPKKNRIGKFAPTSSSVGDALVDSGITTEGGLPAAYSTGGVDVASAYYQAYGIPAPGSAPATTTTPAAGTPVPGFPGLFLPAFPGSPASGAPSPAGNPPGSPSGAVPGFALPGMPGFYVPAYVPAGLPTAPATPATPATPPPVTVVTQPAQPPAQPSTTNIAFYEQPGYWPKVLLAAGVVGLGYWWYNNKYKKS